MDKNHNTLEDFQNHTREKVTKVLITTPEELQETINVAVNMAFANQPQIVHEPPKNLRSIAALADFLGCSTVTAQKIKNSGILRFYQAGRKVIFKSNEVLEDLAYRGGKL